MKKKAVKDVSASVRARLLNLARSAGRDFQELTIRYTVERFLARLAESEHREQFILKGAVLYIPLAGGGASDLQSLAHRQHTVDLHRYARGLDCSGQAPIAWWILTTACSRRRFAPP